MAVNVRASACDYLQKLPYAKRAIASYLEEHSERKYHETSIAEYICRRGKVAKRVSKRGSSKYVGQNFVGQAVGVAWALSADLLDKLNDIIESALSFNMRVHG